MITTQCDRCKQSELIMIKFTPNESAKGVNPIDLCYDCYGRIMAFMEHDE